ncbi:MAG: hypothetical protein IIA66_11280 [Planctomycetes bacterium]|nr:hypothetical protein [Planctomycetota bacterium]
MTPRFLQSVFGLKPAIQSTLRARFAKSVLDRRPALIVLLYHAVDPNPPRYLHDLGVVDPAARLRRSYAVGQELL